MTLQLQPQTRAAIEQCASESLAGRRSFPEVVASLAAVGVGSYFADYRRGATTYYAGEDASVTLKLPHDGPPIAQEFDAAALQATIRGAQRGEIRYPEFVRRSRAAGCVGYFVWIAGRHVSYFGARGETHIERFPGSD